MTEKLWKLTVFMTDGREKVIALYDDEGEALVDALLLAEDDRLLGYQIEPVKCDKWEVNKKCKNTA
ncbi:transporter [Escherichia coli O157:H7]|nr:transporter [Escherichia coli O157:H7]EFB2722030.1 transporter [Escherichia coli O157:H7]